MEKMFPKLSNDELSIEKVIDELEKSKESIHVIRSLILQRSRLNVIDDQEFQKSLDHHSLMVLNHIVSSLTMLRSYDYEGNANKRRKISSLGNENDILDDDCGDTPTKKHPFSKGKRGFYKRRRSGDSRVMEVTHLSDDGFAWRKYGQKEILNAKHPRNYYRCTHKHEQNCVATKKVQQISENPTKYLVTYIGNHTCNSNNSILNPSPILQDSPQDYPSAILLSFDNNSSRVNNNPCLFPTTTFHGDSIKQEVTPLLIPQDACNGVPNQYSPCSDLTAVTGQSSTILFDRNDEIISAVDPNLCSTSASVADIELDYSNFMLDDYSQMLLDW
ncbi:hypothetical protein KSS87_019606 [Heliosperma pusillum]|nr:hypothetical protein KSS87_019606 [Heliosperma pusillum]